jgi:hypothetical protein
MSDEETWTINAGDWTFTVPRLPFRVSRVVYPICQRLTNAGLVERLATAGASFEVTEAEVDDLAQIAFLACQAADPGLTRDAFDDLPITPPQLFDAFFSVRQACGGWRRLPAVEGQEPSGEASGDQSPTSTSTTSSPN